MLEVNLFDREFIHTEKLLGYITCSDRLRPTNIKWVNGLMNYDGITVFTERFITSPIVDSVNSKIKVAWLLEPRVINPNGYNNIIKLENKFDYILTYDSILLERSDKYLKYIVGQSRIDNPKIHKKNKLISMIASNKTMTSGHRFRHEIAKSFGSKFGIDMWGSGYRYFKNKEDPLKDYYFSISIMNCKVDNFFTEVLLDNFRLGTIPIFWGCPNIGEYFDERGIITFDTIAELNDILENLTIKTYTDKLDFVEKNFNLVKEYISTDDSIGRILKKL